jgi:hypothetical protein
LVAWVEVPTVSYNTDTDIYIYYGNTLGVADQWNISGTWDENGANNYKAVWHLDEEVAGTGTTDLYQDSSGNLNHGDDQTASTGQAGQVNGGQEFDGSADDVLAPDYDILNELTISAWINADVLGTSDGIISKRTSTEVNGNWALRVDGTNPDRLEWIVWTGSGSSDRSESSAASLSATNWIYVVMTYDDAANTVEFFIDGSPDLTDTGMSNSIIDNPQQIAIGWAGQGSQFFNGHLDEVRLSNNIRTAEWIETEYNNQFSPSTFFKPLGSQEQPGITPAGKTMDLIVGSAGSTLTFDTAGQDAYWYTDITYPTGQDDATIAAGSYTLNMHFSALPGIQSWWDTNYASRKQLTVSAGSSDIPADYPVRLEFDHAALTPAQSLASGDDIRIAYYDGTWTELDRALFDDGINSSSWDSATTTIMFKTEAAISASGSDTGYYLYYDYSSAVSPPTNTPSSRYYIEQQLPAFSTSSTTYQDTGASLVFTPSDTSEHWVVVATWRQQEPGTAGTTSYLGRAQVRINGTPRTGTDTITYRQSRDAYISSGAMFKITGTTAQQTIDVQFRANGLTDEIDDIRILAFMIPDPANADIQYSESLALVNDISATPVDALTHTFSPSSAGDYIWMANGFHAEAPGASTAGGLFIEDETATDQQESDESYITSGNGYVYIMHFEERTLTTGSKTFIIRHQPDPTGSERQGLSMLTFRSDVFEGVETADDSTLTSTSSGSPQTKVSLTTATQASERDYVYLAVMMHDDTGTSSLTDPTYADIRHASSPMMAVQMQINRGGYDTNINWAFAENTTGNQTILQRYWGSGTSTAQARYAHILALRYKEPASSLGSEEGQSGSVDITVSVHHTAADGSDPQLITSAATTIDGTTSDPLALDLGAGAEQTFTSADPRLIRVQVHVDSLSVGTSFDLAYDSATDISSLDTPTVTVPEFGLILIAFVVLIPVLTTLITNRRRRAVKIITVLITSIIALSLLATQVGTVTAAPDVYYLHDTFVGSSPSWYDADWGYRNKITIDNTKVNGTSDFSYFPVLVSITETEWADTSNGGKVVQADGGDILFTSSNGTTKLDHEIESYDETSGALVAWVEVPTLSYNTDTDIFIYYGNSLDGSNQWNITGTWDEGGASNYKGVWHLDEEASGTGTADLYQDSTSYSNHLDDTVTATGQDGQINGGQAFDDASNDQADIPDPGGAWNFSDGGLDAGTSDFTASAWVNLSSLNGQSFPTILDKGGGSPTSFGYWFNYQVSSDTIDLRVSDGTNRFIANSNTGIGLATDDWEYVTAVFDREPGTDTAYFYLNGSPVGSEASSLIAGNSASGSQDFEVGGTGWLGGIDEVRMADTVRSADWVATEFNNQSTPSTFFKPLGTQETPVVAPSGKEMNTTIGAGASTLTFDTAGQKAYWYSDVTYPTGADDASIAAGNYTFNLYFNSLPPAPGSFPVVEGTITSQTTVASTSHTVSLPASIQTGELLIVLVGGYADTTGSAVDISWPVGWNEFFEEDATVDPNHLAVAGAWREADGSEGASISVTTNRAVLAAHNSYRISGAADPAAQPPEAASIDFTDSGGTTIDPPSLSPTGGAKDYLWLAVASWRRTGRNLTSTPQPTNYTDTLNEQSTGGSAGMRLASSRRQLNAASEDPGVFTLDSNSERRIGATIAVHPATPEVDITVSVHHTAANGTDPQLITSASTTIDSSSTDPQALDLGAGALQTFTSADPRLLRVVVTVDSVAEGASFVLDYDSVADPSSLDTPVVTVPEWGMAFLLLVPLIPFLMSAIWRRRRLAGNIATVALGAIVAISLLAGQVTPTTAAPDVFYLHTDPTSGLTPAGEYMDLIEGTGGGSSPTQVTGTVDTTTTSTTDTAVSGMSITPGAGDYLVWFSGSVENSVTGYQYVSLYLNGSQIAHTEREIRTESSIPPTSFPVATHARLTGVTAGQTIEVQWRTTAGTATMHQRTLVVQAMTPADTFQASATADTTTISATDELVSGMTLTPGAGDYLVWFSGSVEGSTANSWQYVSIYQNGSQVAHSEREIHTETSIPSTSFPVASHALITGLGASQAIEIQWRTTAATATMHERTLVVQKIDTADTSQATATADTTTTSATDIPVSAMSLTPGAGDYLIWFSGSVESSATSIQNVSLYVNGSQIAHTERKITTEGSIPDTSFPVAAHAYVTGIGASDTIEVQWRTSAGTATMHERTLVVQSLPASGKKTFNSAGSTYWYHDVAWPTGNDDATIAAGSYTFNMYFDSLPSGPATWYDTDWQYRKQITVQSAEVDANVSNFPVYVDLADLGADFFSNVNADGGDIRVTNSGGVTEMPREVVDISTGGQTGELHFRADSLSSSANTSFYIYYGNSGASDYAVTATYGRNNVWSNSYEAVYHLEEETAGTGTANLYVDSTGNGYDGDDQVSATGQLGRLGAGQELDGYDDFINMGDVLDFADPSGFVLEA